MPIEGVTVTKIIESQQLGVHNDKIIYVSWKIWILFKVSENECPWYTKDTL